MIQDSAGSAVHHRRIKRLFCVAQDRFEQTFFQQSKGQYMREIIWKRKFNKIEPKEWSVIINHSRFKGPYISFIYQSLTRVMEFSINTIFPAKLRPASPWEISVWAVLSALFSWGSVKNSECHVRLLYRSVFIMVFFFFFQSKCDDSCKLALSSLIFHGNNGSVNCE